jgi:hypothetical protein
MVVVGAVTVTVSSSSRPAWIQQHVKKCLKLQECTADLFIHIDVYIHVYSIYMYIYKHFSLFYIKKQKINVKEIFSFSM